MVIQISPIPSPHTTHKRHQPVLKYTHDETLIASLGVKSKLFGVRRRLVRLERGILYIHAQEDDCGEPLATTTLCEAQAVSVNHPKATVSIRTTSKVGITLVFKHDVSLLNLWASALKRAVSCKLDTYYKLCGKIGQGHYATVYEGVDRNTGDKVAIKVMSKKQKELKLTQYVNREAEIVRSVSHPNIVRTLDVFETSSHLYVVMEYMTNGTLLDFFAGGKNRVNEKNTLRIARQLLSGIAYLHSSDIVHRDIKPENILLSADGVVKIADFGLARRVDGVASDQYCLSSILGTPAYCSPEVVARAQYGKPVDIFGCGVLMYVAMSGMLPFRGDTPEQVFRSISKGVVTFPDARWDLVSPHAKRFVASLLQHRPSNRPTAVEALRHPWLVSNGDRTERPVSPTPFVRNTSARVAHAAKNYNRMPTVNSTPSFRRAQSGSLDQLRREKRENRRAL
ncbi:putative myosin light chain kinase [Gracilariopsis chorda]|uniref:Putative myosin light chain kinase n=1 Tax=Gracilariopsis chorda TaxID=448386 RepID=A0A2V3IWC0_9FLOR|nr:putative myosin light chain kinase [Gracilariopsis chorda]|eukprot:PXF46373.1 putative myosin light chain kinase [Gracilariopsis chorda]